MVEDCLFLAPRQAYATAKLRQRVPLTEAVSGLQVCYLLADPSELSDIPENLVPLPRDSAALIDFLARTRLRLPVAVMWPEDMPAEQQEAPRQQLSALINAAQARRQELASEVAAGYAQRRAHPRPANERLRVMAWVSRATTVMQWCARSLLSAFADLGHEVELVIEANEMEALEELHRLQAAEKFDPHLLININHPNNQSLPSDLVNVVWWQDPPELLLSDQVAWRERDIVYTVADYFAPALVATGLRRERISVQPFCVDPKVFYPSGARQNKVVFVGTGSSLIGQTVPEQKDRRTPEADLVLALYAILEAGKLLSGAEVAAIGASYGLSALRSICDLYYSVLRDGIVRWLCQAATTAGIDVEVYGRNWERDPMVTRFCRGELPHGSVANVYRSAKYALVLHPFSVNSQRLGEVGACGCIPLIYDCRRDADPPYWEEQALYFHSQVGLLECLRSERTTTPEKFANFFEYSRFARRILEDAAPLLR